MWAEFSTVLGFGLTLPDFCESRVGPILGKAKCLWTSRPWTIICVFKLQGLAASKGLFFWPISFDCIAAESSCSSSLLVSFRVFSLFSLRLEHSPRAIICWSSWSILEAAVHSLLGKQKKSFPHSFYARKRAGVGSELSSEFPGISKVFSVCPDPNMLQGASLILENLLFLWGEVRNLPDIPDNLHQRVN